MRATVACARMRLEFPVGLLFVLFLAAALPANDRDWLQQANRMESQAQDARKDYWAGRYEDAQRQFADLTQSTHGSVILYLNERAMCSLALDNPAEAERHLRQVDALLNTYTSVEREKRAASVFGAEAEKVYRGDPYEQAMAYLLLALILLDKGDYDNALAACKSGILADSDATENLFDSDVALLHALEAKCCLLRGDQEAFRTRRDAAVKSVQLTSEQVRDDFSKRLDLMALLRMSRGERKKLGETRSDNEIRAEIDRLSARLDQQVEAIDGAKLLGPLYTGDYNTLILVPCGRSVKKARTGADAEMVIFVEDRTAAELPDVYLDGQPLDSKQRLATDVDVDFQAMTRGGRRMDAILRGKAASRATTRGVGQTLTQAGSNVGGIGGLGVALIGAAVQGTAGAMTPEADTRCWQTLPASFQIYALKLAPGSHEVNGAHYVYFQKKSEFRHSFALSGETDMAVVITPASPQGLYCSRAESKLSERDREGMGRASVLLVAPPTGVEDIIRVRMNQSDEKLEAIAPDPKRLMRSVRDGLTAGGFSAALVSHEEAVQSRTKLAQSHSCAVQCEFLAIQKEGTRKSGTYRTKLSFALVKAGSGQTLLNTTVEAVTDAAGGPTTAFYKGVVDATRQFAGHPDLRRLAQ